MKQSTDGLTVMLLLAIIYMLLKDRESQAAAQPDAVIDRVCPYCNFVSSAKGYANVSRSLTAHIRQMHPDHWRHLRTAGNDTH